MKEIVPFVEKLVNEENIQKLIKQEKKDFYKEQKVEKSQDLRKKFASFL